MTGDAPVELLDLAALAHAARIAGHSEAAIAKAAGLPEYVPRRQGMTVDEVVAAEVAENHLSHPEDIAIAREVVEKHARQLGITSR